jgi:hypothetical protein
MLDAKRLDDTDRYYLPCNKIENYPIVAFDLLVNQDQEFRFHARHLVTPVSFLTANVA